jgi:dolichol-phosphate mannosyltransferase
MRSRVMVIVPACDEAPRIRRVIEGVPSWVDGIVVVDDASADGTAEAARAAGDPRVEVVRHGQNRGVGAAIATGYRRAQAMTKGDRDAYVVMAGDGQMHPGDLPGLVTPIARGEADYVKGNRFRSVDVVFEMPAPRLFGGLVLSWLTSRALGTRVRDSQCGYTAICRRASVGLDLDSLWPRYGYPNDLLSQLVTRGERIVEIPVRAVYGDEVSRLKPRHWPAIGAIVARAWVRRVRRGHPNPTSRPQSPLDDSRHVGERVVEAEEPI